MEMNSENISLKYLTAKPNNLFVNWLAKQEQENEPSPEPRAKPKKMDEEKSGIESTWVTLNKFPRYEISKTIPYVVREKVLKTLLTTFFFREYSLCLLLFDELILSSLFIVSINFQILK